MASNDLSFNQISTLVTAIAKQATGKDLAVPVNTNEFVTLGTTLLKAGTENITKAVSTLMGETIFSIRPYDAMFSILTKDKSRYLAHARKINYGDTDFEDDIAFDTDVLVDGVSVDPWKIKKGKVVQTNFYGQNVVADHITIFEDQYDFSFTDAGQWGEFISGTLQTIDDKFTQGFENTSRLALCNFIASIITQVGGNSSPRIIKLFTEYNDITGLNLDITNYRDPQYFGDFAKWVVSRIKTASKDLRQRNVIYHDNIKFDIPRHSPFAKQKGIFYAPILEHMNTNVLSDAFHDGYLKFEHEEIPFWQSLSEKDRINVVPNYVDANGDIQVGNAVDTSTVFGIIFDDEAIGHSIFNNRIDSTRLNPAGLYYNIFYHYRSSWWNDTTENAILMVLE